MINKEVGRLIKKIAFLSSFTPRECGIANFTKDLINSIFEHKAFKTEVIALNDKESHYHYDRRVKFQIDAENKESYLEAANYINRSNIELVSIQHEFGLFGGEWGEYVLDLVNAIDKPIVTTLHTIPLKPAAKAKLIIEALASECELVIMNKTAKRLLLNKYVVRDRHIHVIPHGCPDVPFISKDTRDHIKFNLGLRNRFVLSTFGLISRGKGIEYAIKALPAIVEDTSNILYLVIGATHPQVRKIEGETYRRSLLSLAEDLGLEKNVRFYNRYLSLRELVTYLQATDIYLTPFIERDQISSGTLMYAMGTGKAIISTPYLHAEEALTNGRGLLCRFKDPKSMAKNIVKLVKNEKVIDKMGKRAYDYSRKATWPKVAKRYIDLFSKLT